MTIATNPSDTLVTKNAFGERVITLNFAGRSLTLPADIASRLIFVAQEFDTSLAVLLLGDKPLSGGDCGCVPSVAFRPASSAKPLACVIGGG